MNVVCLPALCHALKMCVSIYNLFKEDLESSQIVTDKEITEEQF